MTPCRPPSARRRGASEQASAVETPTIGRPQPVGQALGRGDPDAQPGEGARTGPDDDPGQPRPADVLLAEEAPDRRQQRLAVPIAGGPGRDPVRLPVGRPGGDHHLRRRGVDREERVPPAVVRRRHGIASRYRRRSGVPARIVIVRVASPAPSMTGRRAGAAGSARGHPVGPFDERHAVGLPIVDQAARQRVGPRRPAGRGRRGTAAGARRTRPSG